MSVTIIGPGLFERNAEGQLCTRIATAFPAHRVLVTVPGIHAWQRAKFLIHLNDQRQCAAAPTLTPAEEEAECAASVDLFVESDHVLIRPHPEHMDLAFAADDLLQELVSKRKVRFLFVTNAQVRQAIKERGECWRISALPQTRAEMVRLIASSRLAIGGRPIYYYNRVTGTRYLTCHELRHLETLPAPELAFHLQEITDHCRLKNRHGNPELDFFASADGFGPANFPPRDYSALPEAACREHLRALATAFTRAVPQPFRNDDPQDEQWRNRIYSALIGQRDETLTEEVLQGLSPEFYLQIAWLPGGRFEEGEFSFDSVFEEFERQPGDPELARLCDLTARGFIFNFLREFGDLEYLNVGRVATPLAGRLHLQGRRGVYLVELKQRGAPLPLVRYIRMQKWGVRERLDHGEGLLQAMIETEEYTDYILDRRLGCRQLGMNLPPCVTVRRVQEAYAGHRTEFRGQFLWAPYFERDYVRGFVTAKLPQWKLADPEYALRLARLLGAAAAPNLIAGRAREEDGQVIFDDGDEVVIEDAQGLPRDLIVSDHSGAFGDYQAPLANFSAGYARPVNTRLMALAQPGPFARAYLEALAERFRHIQGDYRKRRRAFDSLFKYRRYDRAGSFAYRWEQALERLDRTDPAELLETIRRHITWSTAPIRPPLDPSA
ncbi:MAG: hypothetical protein FJ387_03480 [Verrucomicrobia bacterium]|nr:hypothetical protein [Verrucomicrobiota bacterium]